MRKIAAGLFTSLDGVVESPRWPAGCCGTADRYPSRSPAPRRSAPASCISVTRRFLKA